MTLSTGQIAKLLWPGLTDIYGQTYNLGPEEWRPLFEVQQSEKNFEEDQAVQGLGLLSTKTEGGNISYDDWKQTYNTRYTAVTYALGMRVTMEAIMDKLYKEQTSTGAMMLARSSKETRETVTHNVLNRAFNSSFTGGDGKELCATDHPLAAGNTWQNELTTAADISEAALEEACIEIGKWTDDKGLKIMATPMSVHVPVDIQFEAERILMNPHRPATAERDINAMFSQGKFPNGIFVHRHLTDTDAWFIKTDVMRGLKYIDRMADTLSDDNDFNSKDLRFSLVTRYDAGFTDPRGIFGSPGA